MNKFLKEILTLAAEFQGAKGFNAVMIANDIERLYESHIAEIKGDVPPVKETELPLPPECDHDFDTHGISAVNMGGPIPILVPYEVCRKCGKTRGPKPECDHDFEFCLVDSSGASIPNAKTGAFKCRKCGVAKPLADDDIRWTFQPMPKFDEPGDYRKDENNPILQAGMDSVKKKDKPSGHGSVWSYGEGPV